MPDSIHSITATEAARTFSDVLNRVAYQHETLEISRGGRAVARMVPVLNRRGVKVKDLNKLLAELPKLGEDAESFASDVRNAGKQTIEDPWA